MILCEALNWLRANNMTAHFSATEVSIHKQPMGQLFRAPTIESAVEQAVCASAKPGDTVAEAARRGFQSYKEPT